MPFFCCCFFGGGAGGGGGGCFRAPGSLTCVCDVFACVGVRYQYRSMATSKGLDINTGLWLPGYWFGLRQAGRVRCVCVRAGWQSIMWLGKGFGVGWQSIMWLGTGFEVGWQSTVCLGTVWLAEYNVAGYRL